MTESVQSFQRLSGPWSLATDPSNEGRAERWFKAARKEARPTPVPGIIQQVFPDYHGVAWYWTTFRMPRRAVGNERVLIKFGAVDYLAEVWVNGKPVGGHEGGETPFELDVTAAASASRENLLAVRAINPHETPIDGFVLKETPHRHKASVNYMPGRSYNHGGFYLPVELAIMPAVRIESVFARPDWRTGCVAVTITVRNATSRPARGRLCAFVEPAFDGELIETAASDCLLAVGESAHRIELSVADPRLWSLDDPYLYRVQVSLCAQGRGAAGAAHSRSVRFGFRDFRVKDGFFYLNGKRLFLKSSHTGNHFPIGQITPMNPDLMRRDLLYAKACGFNMIRFIAGVAWPEQLDCCDEIGLMVYEEHLAGWELADSPHMAERYDRSTREMILRDRNHPSVTIWGMLNETGDGPVFRHAVAALQLVRDLDDSRLVLLASGRWDCDPSIGSVCNPGGRKWEHQWGAEKPGADKTPGSWNTLAGGYFDKAGDAHTYPQVPLLETFKSFLRNLGKDTKPVFLSEFGTGSLFNVVDEYRKFEEVGAREDLPDMALIRSMRDKLAADWKRYGMEKVYPFLEDFLRDSYRLHIRERRVNFDLLRSNPNLCGHNVTGLLDHGISGEGLWTFWREWKPGIADALRDGWAPLRWCLFVTPEHGYAGRTVRLEAVLANEGALLPGRYPVHFKVSGPGGVIWEKRVHATVPKSRGGRPGPLAIPVLLEEARLFGSAGEYVFAASLEHGGAPLGDRKPFRLSDAKALPERPCDVTVWGLPPQVVTWLGARGVRCRPFQATRASRQPELILAGDASPAGYDAWSEVLRRVGCGGAVVFVTPEAFKNGTDKTCWLPLRRKGTCNAFNDWLYHKECVGKDHPVFEGVQSGGILDWSYYDQIIPHAMFEGLAAPDETMAAAFATGYACPGGYASGLLMGAYRFHAGAMFLNTLRILEHIDVHPAADRLLLNLIAYARQGLGARQAPLPAGFETDLSARLFEMRRRVVGVLPSLPPAAAALDACGTAT